MKQKLRLGDCYALTKHKLKQFKIRYISLLAVGMIMCLYAAKQVSAQQAEPAAAAVADIQHLKIGDVVPEETWSTPLKLWNADDNSMKNVKLNNYQGKIIILDLWTT